MLGIFSYEMALEFMNGIRDVTPVLVYRYHPEKPFSWRSPREFPYCSQRGRKTARVYSHYTIPNGYLSNKDVALLTTFNEFQTTSIVFDGISVEVIGKYGMKLGELYSKSETINFLNKFRGITWGEELGFTKIKLDDMRASMLKKRMYVLEQIINKMCNVEHSRGQHGIAVNSDVEARLWQKLNRQKYALEKGIYRIVGIE